jgi:hypothetical protein
VVAQRVANFSVHNVTVEHLVGQSFLFSFDSSVNLTSSRFRNIDAQVIGSVLVFN